jgi:hypothetical protein
MTAAAVRAGAGSVTFLESNENRCQALTGRSATLPFRGGVPQVNTRHIDHSSCKRERRSPVVPDASAPAVTSTATAPSPAVPRTAAEERLAYRLFTGPDDRSFCERVSTALAEGYVLHGSPSATFNGSTVIVAQAVVLPAAIASADAAVADAVEDLDNDAYGFEDVIGGHA